MSFNPTCVMLSVLNRVIIPVLLVIIILIENCSLLDEYNQRGKKRDRVTYDFDLTAVLVLRDLAAAFLVEVGSVDPGLQLFDFS